MTIEFKSRSWGFWISFGSFWDHQLQLTRKYKILWVYPEKFLSNQKHNFRKEIWLVLSGTLTFGNRKITQGSPPVEIKIGEWHRIRNDSYDEPLIIFETQIGKRTDEDDIERES